MRRPGGATKAWRCAGRLAADRDVLQVRIVRTQATGGGAGLVVAGVHAAGGRIAHQRQLLRVRVAQLAEAAVFEHQARQLVLLGDRLQRLFVGRGRAARGLHQRRQLQFLEQQLAQLLGRIQVDRPADHLVGAQLQRVHALRQRRALPAQLVHVDRHAVGLHAFEHRHQRHLDLAVHARQAGLRGQLRRQFAVQAQGDVGVLGGVGGGFLERHLREGNLLRALAGHVLVADGRIAQVTRGQRIHVVALPAGVEHEALQHGVLGVAAHRHAVAAEDVKVVLAVLADLGSLRVFEDRAQRVERFASGSCVGAPGYSWPSGM
jgi:hypothetical protein